jgi:pimeloyl-ACP methyl ester carboxylesterase
MTSRSRMRDISVLLPGISGSVLSGRSGGDIWGMSVSGLWGALSTLGGNLRGLTVPCHNPRHEAPRTEIQATRLVGNFHGIPGLWKIDGYTDLARLIRDQFIVTGGSLDDDAPGNFFEFPYDWRLSNRVSARRLKERLDVKLRAWRTHSDGDPEAKVILLAHSMGGLVSRYYLEVLGGWRDCRALITFGTPYRGSVDSVNYIANGYKKAMVDLTDVLRSCPSVYELFPIYRAVQDADGEWKRPREVSIPNAVPDYVDAAAAFHDEIRERVQENDTKYGRARYRILPYLGVGQKTLQTASLSAGTLRATHGCPTWIDPELEGGDGTVPRVSGTPIELSAELRETFFGERHASLQRNAYALEDVRQRLRQMQSIGLSEIQGGTQLSRPTIGVEVDDLYLHDEPAVIRATVSPADGAPHGLLAELEPEAGGASTRHAMLPDGDGWTLVLEGLAAGLHRVRVRPARVSENAPLAVQDVFAVSTTG